MLLQAGVNGYDPEFALALPGAPPDVDPRDPGLVQPLAGVDAELLGARALGAHSII